MSREFLAPLPLGDAELEQYRLQARRLRRPNMLGGHITRRRGQSLEFREYAQYTVGDDIRHVDWRASLRVRGRGAGRPGGDWLVRKFSAEDHFQLVISIDNRSTMALPRVQAGRGQTSADLSKLQAAHWLASAIATAALRSGDAVVLHRLFGATPAAFPLRGSRGQDQLEAGLAEITPAIMDVESPQLESLERHLPPTAVWVIITDFYFDAATASSLIERIASAQDGMRWVMLVDLDSWPYERSMLERGPRLRLIRGPKSPGEKRFDSRSVQVVDERIRLHKQRILADCRGSADLVHWPWPTGEDVEAGATLAAFFRTRFLNDETIRHLFEREAWS